MILRLPRMAPHLLRHAGALARVGASDAAEAAGHYGAAAGKLAVAGAAGFVAVLMACAWLLAAAWDTEWRVPTAGLLTGAFALFAAVFALQGRRRLAAVQPFAATRRNVEADQRLYAELRPESAAQPPVAPEVQLERSRAEIRHIATRPSVLSTLVNGAGTPAGGTAAASSSPASAGVTAGAHRRAVRPGASARAGFPRSRTMQILTRGPPGLH